MKQLAIGIAACVVGLSIVGYWINGDVQEFRQENGIKTTVTGARMYTVVWKGCEYVVIEDHRGIGISPVGIPNRLPADDVFNIPQNISK